MANQEHLKILKQGVEAWNTWREQNPEVRPDLHEADLSGGGLSRANLRGAKLSEAKLSGAKLRGADLYEANLREASPRQANLYEADLHRADLSGADLRGAILRKAVLVEAHLTKANLSGADLSGAKLVYTIFAFVDLSTVKGLGACVHIGPSTLDTHTLMQSKNLPEVFLRGCGVSDSLITHLPSHVEDSPIQIYTFYISYSTQDDAFATRLYNDLQGKGVRCWYAPEDMKGGDKIYDQIDTAIRLHDKLLLVLSEHSLESEWVLTEIRRCRKSEKRDGTRKLFPLRLVSMEVLKEWDCFDTDSGRDLAVDIREYFLPDFSDWKNHDTYHQAFERLLRDLEEAD